MVHYRPEPGIGFNRELVLHPQHNFLLPNQNWHHYSVIILASSSYLQCFGHLLHLFLQPLFLLFHVHSHPFLLNLEVFSFKTSNLVNNRFLIDQHFSLLLQDQNCYFMIHLANWHSFHHLGSFILGKPIFPLPVPIVIALILANPPFACLVLCLRSLPTAYVIPSSTLRCLNHNHCMFMSYFRNIRHAHPFSSILLPSGNSCIWLGDTSILQLHV